MVLGPESVTSYETEIVVAESQEEIELEVTVQLRAVREIVVVEACDRSEVEPGVQKNTGGWPVRI
jgi:hypothetical protein